MSFFRSSTSSTKKSQLPSNPFTSVYLREEHEAYEAHNTLATYLANLNPATPELTNWIAASNINKPLPAKSHLAMPKNLTFYHIASLMLQLEELKKAIQEKHPDIAHIDIANIDSIINIFRAFPQFKNMDEIYGKYKLEHSMIYYIDDLLGKFKDYEHTVLRDWIRELKNLFQQTDVPKYVVSPFDIIATTVNKLTAEGAEEFSEKKYSFRLQVHALNEELKALRADAALGSTFNGNETVVLDDFVSHLTESFKSAQYAPPLVALNETTIRMRF